MRLSAAEGPMMARAGPALDAFSGHVGDGLDVAGT